MGMDLEITPEPSDQERAAIEAALEQDSQAKRPSAWASVLLPEREDELDP